MDKKLLGTILVEGLSYDEYVRMSDEKLKNLEFFNVDPDEENKYGYLKLNSQRIHIRNKSFTPAEKSVEFIKNLNEELIWFLLVADWCGDCAQNLPVINKLATLNLKIHLKLLPRDLYPQVMDKYLTNGARSIPKLIVMKRDGGELFVWGEKPAPAMALVSELKQRGLQKDEISEKLHLWYGKDRGKTTEEEIVQLLQNNL